MKERLDVLLVKRNLAASREKAKARSYSSICQPRRSETGKSDQEF